MALRRLDLNWALTAALPPLDFVLPGLLPGTFGLLVAPGGTGKSNLALEIAVSVALGRPIAGGLFPRGCPGKVVFLAGEENDRLLAERIRPMLQISQHATPILDKNLVLLPMSGESCVLVEDGRPTSLYDELKALCNGARLVIIDPLRRTHNGDENSSSDMTSFVVMMEELAKAAGAAVLGVHHANRASAGDVSSQNAARGSSALVDGARWQLNLSRMDEKSAAANMVSEAERPFYLAVDFAKANYLPPRPRCWLKRQPGGVLVLETFAAAKPFAKGLGGARIL